MVHGDGAGEDDASTYLQRWALMTPALAAHMVRLMGEPTSRTIVMSYPREGGGRERDEDVAG